jgi:hypothetical protein
MDVKQYSDTQASAFRYRFARSSPKLFEQPVSAWLAIDLPIAF